MFKVGDEFNYKFKISKDIYDGFINIFNDKNPMHVDLDFAKKHGYSEIVMHGNILNGFISYFIGELLPVKNIVILSQNIKFSNPVHLNDHLQFKASVYEIYESVNVINFKFKFINQKNITVAKGKVQIKKI
jgi:3-hydroxybutyryl-CoA dehydratase